MFIHCRFLFKVQIVASELISLKTCIKEAATDIVGFNFEAVYIIKVSIINLLKLCYYA